MAQSQPPMDPASSIAGRSLSGYQPPKVPEGYTPDRSLPPGYIPPAHDLQRTGAMARDAARPMLTRRQTIWLVVGGAALVAIIATVVTLVIGTLFLQNTLSGPETALDTYYSDLRNQNYVSAYAQLSATAQRAQSESDFAAYYQQLDLVGGTITSFSIDASSTSGSTGSAQVSISRSNDSHHVTIDQVTLIDTNGTWQISGITSRTSTASPTS
jgi:hypothetical protein